jgi:hypothetical protein
VGVGPNRGAIAVEGGPVALWIKSTGGAPARVGSRGRGIFAHPKLSSRRMPLPHYGPLLHVFRGKATCSLFPQELACSSYVAHSQSVATASTRGLPEWTSPNHRPFR